MTAFAKQKPVKIRRGRATIHLLGNQTLFAIGSFPMGRAIPGG